MVSIIIAVYNGGDYIGKTVESCLNQDYKDIEIIIIDDCSTEDVYKYIPKSEKIIYYRNEKNLGACGTFNKGIEMAKGEFVLVLGQDDILLKNHLSEMMRCFKENVTFVYCDYKIINEKDEIISGLHYGEKSKNVSIFGLSTGNKLHSCGLISRKNSLVQVGGYPYNTKYPNYGEWGLWIKLLSIGEAVFCDTTYGLYRRHSGNMTSEQNMNKNAKIMFEYSCWCRKFARDSGKFNILQNIIYHKSYISYVAYYYIKQITIKLGLYSIYKKIRRKEI